ncbi:hypothetical protein P43SY_008300 [Pythium insidiosum]|uniref:Mog1p/PsbP-like protein n=1 Tax=Pythium insidiosum TaxID=114742 RepID=A0AAD5MAD0_PYTIN|nr:hypothetical protein P43SY_008300 [Pythium insidiosum]
MALRPRELFGGALSCAIPDGFADVSSFRQVPDNQEVFANALTDQCIIVELLQYEADVTDDNSAQFFFNEIASSNGCAPGDIAMLHTQVLPSGHPSAPRLQRASVTTIAAGDQRVAKFKEGEAAKNVVRVYIGNVSVTTDVVISVSAPLQISDLSSSRDAFQLENSAEVGAEIFKHVLESFTVHDWDLFM